MNSYHLYFFWTLIDNQIDTAKRHEGGWDGGRRKSAGNTSENDHEWMEDHPFR